MAVRLGMTLLVRDEIDIIRRHVEHHLPRVDFFAITDNASLDGTREYLDSLRGDSRVAIFDEPGNDYRQDAWVDRMIRAALAAGCDWVINSDADEFWMGNLRGIADEFRGEANALRFRSKMFVATVRDPKEADPLLRMSYRLRTLRKHEIEFQGCWHKLAHALTGWKANFLGNHDVIWQPGVVARTKDVPESSGMIRHYPERGWGHYRKKHIQGGEAYTRSSKPKEFGKHWREKYAVYATGGITALKDLWLRQSLVQEVDALCLYDPWPGGYA